MRGGDHFTRAGWVRLAVGLLVVTSTVIALPIASAAKPGRPDAGKARADVAAAKARLAALNERQSLLDEEYDQARIALATAERKLADARAAAKRSAATARDANADLSARVRVAYEGAGSEIGALLGAGSLSDFSDRLEFLNQIAADDATVVSRATVAGQRAQWAAAALTSAVEERTAAVSSLRSKRSELVGAVAEQERLISHLESVLHRVLNPPPPPPPPIVLPQPGPSPVPIPGATQPPPTGAPPPAPSPTSLPVPPPPSSRAQVAIQAALSQVGVPYQYGGSTPGVGFDCSGLTMWAWGQAGVSLPHSSAMQYSVLPHVDRSQLQPGDLLFFYSPIHHVGMYLGGGRMVHAPHTGAYVEVVDVYWQYYVGAARPG
jgi:peptidoglycan DL-endopeptidase CwlO